MITHRLNKLIRAYRIAKQQLGEANQGKAINAICMRRLSRLRPIVMDELRLIAFQVELMRRARKGLHCRSEFWDLSVYVLARKTEGRRYRTVSTYRCVPGGSP